MTPEEIAATFGPGSQAMDNEEVLRRDLAQAPLMQNASPLVDTPASHIRNALTILNQPHDSCWPEVAVKVDPRDLDAIRIRLTAALALLEAK